MSDTRSTAGPARDAGGRPPGPSGGNTMRPPAPDAAGVPDDALERLARRAFADAVAGVDPATRARLAATRRRAVAAIPAPAGTPARPLLVLGGRPGWAAAGGAAALLAAALVLALGRGQDAALRDPGPLAAADRGAADGTAARAAGSDRAPIEPFEPFGPPGALVGPADLELLAGGVPDVLDVLEEDLEFYAWLEHQPELGSSPEGSGR